MEVWDQIEIYENVNAKLLDDDDEHFKINGYFQTVIRKKIRVFFKDLAHKRS
jgi:hypothetical protein